MNTLIQNFTRIARGWRAIYAESTLMVLSRERRSPLFFSNLIFWKTSAVVSIPFP
ncbi:hypothetical protein IQ267_01595 [filamentous cyanobacterium LEGE 07170]|nr:hypothetical protein [filamentous cyanobacterium LEGE 07170]